MDITASLAALQHYVIPSLIGVGSYLISSWAKLKNLAFKEKSQEQVFLEREWSRVGTIRDYVDKRMEAVMKENEGLRARIDHLEEEVETLRAENLKLRLAVNGK